MDITGFFSDFSLNTLQNNKEIPNDKLLKFNITTYQNWNKNEK